MTLKRLGFLFYAAGVVGLFAIAMELVTVKCAVMALTNLLAIIGLGLNVFTRSPSGHSGERGTADHA
ncbi:hypothetical protein EV659_101265 [Rhodothalassium salexigens DSM 2132]|uniref:Uncharacterized protein n=1 Tax=Rhodothalassium salexigens DSM 2132 TaxID=1188247 RepID=A0A4R2PVW7_RHOSA|nr:hypothetical protein [Rhodothalassium salexigens]MBB4210201.1 hypothetical protein [Rhodothalassium salexigens DSM 2132]MBK1638535.1 hypothetical protein [Rhodothalassium salexigens DSM 2132]TCP38365.1 hypothetical protein EV659_101265 [Rhodothalassium salexigens DSM 2132]